jgi:hypothetical protein
MVVHPCSDHVPVTFSWGAEAPELLAPEHQYPAPELWIKLDAFGEVGTVESQRVSPLVDSAFAHETRLIDRVRVTEEAVVTVPGSTDIDIERFTV